MTLLKINRLLPIYINFVPLKFEVDIQSQSKVFGMSGNQKIQYGRQAAILKVASLKINRLLPMATINMHMKFEIEIPKQTWLMLRKPCRLQTDGQTDGRTRWIQYTNVVGRGYKHAWDGHWFSAWHVNNRTWARWESKWQIGGCRALRRCGCAQKPEEVSISIVLKIFAWDWLVSWIYAAATTMCLMKKAVFLFRSISWVLSNRGKPNSQWIMPYMFPILYCWYHACWCPYQATKEHGIACIVLKTYSASSISQ